MRPELVHLAKRDRGRVSPLCGRWGESHNWTLARSVPTCPECRAALEQLEPSSAAPPAAACEYASVPAPGTPSDRRQRP